MNFGQFLSLFLNTFLKWQKHDATLRAAALTFFTIMPLPSLALIALAILGQVYGEQQALGHLTSQISSFAGPSVAGIFSELLSSAQNPLTSIFGSFLAVVFALAGALGAFSVLQKSVDIIWEVKPQRGRSAFIKEKLLPFVLIGVIGLIVVSWAAFSTLLFNTIVPMLIPLFGSFAGFVLRIIELLLSLGLGTLLFAIIFKELPETNVKWGNVWLAAVTTGIIFTGLNYLFSLYLSLFQVTTLGGTAGTLMVLFLWIYLTNLFILFGAQLSKQYSITHGSSPTPKAPLKPEVDRVEMKSEINLKVTTPKKHSEHP
jgi:membrane protein